MHVVRTRSLGILSAITSMIHFKGNEPLLPQVLDMERISEEYERSSGKKLDDDFKTSIFLRSITQNMRNPIGESFLHELTSPTSTSSSFKRSRLLDRFRKLARLLGRVRISHCTCPRLQAPIFHGHCCTSLRHAFTLGHTQACKKQTSNNTKLARTVSRCNISLGPCSCPLLATSYLPLRALRHVT